MTAAGVQHDGSVASGQPPSRNSVKVPAEIASTLEPDESIEAVFSMDDGLEIYATDRRLFGKKDNHCIDICNTEIAETRRRTASWRTWHGIARIVIGIGFVAAGAVTGFSTPMAVMISLVLFMIGAALVLLGILRREDWVELKIQRSEPPPSFWYLVMFLPFWLMLQSGKRYRVTGSRDQVDAIYRYLGQAR